MRRGIIIFLIVLLVLSIGCIEEIGYELKPIGKKNSILTPPI